ncbi:hypothetical protein PGTUg99_002169 [Puccinia graminis f. sp. tritici]|uniref:Uncharacterized protein n=1 Tax=Puccinia graminis f. sp. tritici TaxID=56615 RepID=A0A5B0Q0E8_PUCGR|nr:hypothetical protein PGTUg99_002169 [Puccinia graminis f. sp. tritici]
MIIALGFNFCTSLIVVVKIRLLLIETYWQVTLSSLIAVTCVLLSLSLLIQSVTNAHPTLAMLPKDFCLTIAQAPDSD